MNRFVKYSVAASFLTTVYSASAFAQATDTDIIEVQAEVVGDMAVTAMNSPINLGQLFQGTTAVVAADGSNASFPTSGRFDITGPTALTWRLTVAYADLAGPAPATPIVISAPPGVTNDICFNTTIGSQAPCTASGDTPFDVVEANHVGDGSAWVGFQFAVPLGATAGAYTNASALTLTAEGLLGT